MPQQQIHCNVTSCRHNDQKHECKLPDITVGNCCPTPHECSDTECGSFEER